MWKNKDSLFKKIEYRKGWFEVLYLKVKFLFRF